MNKSNLKFAYQKFKAILNNIKGSHISEYSAQCAYYTILSFIPFVILLMSLVKYTGLDAQTVFALISKVVPESMGDYVLGVVEEAYSKSLGTISISVLFTLWSAGKSLFALTKALQSIYNTNSEENASYIYLRVKSLIGTIAFIIIIIFGLLVLVFGDSLISIIQEQFGGFENFNTLSSILTDVASTIALIFVFILLYKFMPKHKVTFRSQIYGAVLGAVSLNIVSFLFSKYLDIFKGFSMTYGSLTALMLVFMWVYSCFYTVLLGAKLNDMVSGDGSH